MVPIVLPELTSIQQRAPSCPTVTHVYKECIVLGMGTLQHLDHVALGSTVPLE